MQDWFCPVDFDYLGKHISEAPCNNRLLVCLELNDLVLKLLDLLHLIQCLLVKNRELLVDLVVVTMLDNEIAELALANLLRDQLVLIMYVIDQASIDLVLKLLS